jgi:hypothetical protein
MKIGAITDSLGALSFDELLGTAAELGIERSEFVAGRWSKRATRPNLRTCRRFRILFTEFRVLGDMSSSWNRPETNISRPLLRSIRRAIPI